MALRAKKRRNEMTAWNDEDYNFNQPMPQDPSRVGAPQPLPIPQDPSYAAPSYAQPATAPLPQDNSGFQYSWPALPPLPQQRQQQLQQQQQQMGGSYRGVGAPIDSGFDEEYYRDDEYDNYDDPPALPRYEPPRPRIVNGKTVAINDDITVQEVRLLDQTKVNLGVVPLYDALQQAEEEEVDLVLISPDADPPVARLIEFSKYKYECERAEKDKKKGAVVQELKELRLRPVTDVHDYQTKLKAATKFLDKGNKVKLSMTFHGRELRFRDQGKELVMKFIDDLGSLAKVEGPLNFRTGSYSVIVSPSKAAVGA